MLEKFVCWLILAGEVGEVRAAAGLKGDGDVRVRSEVGLVVDSGGGVIGLNPGCIPECVCVLLLLVILFLLLFTRTFWAAVRGETPESGEKVGKFTGLPPLEDPA